MSPTDSPSASDTTDWPGRTVVGADGREIGVLEQVYLDVDTEDPEWAVVRGGPDGLPPSFVPLRSASRRGAQVHVAHTVGEVAAAPHLESGQELSPDDEQRLYEHYGFTPAGGTGDTTDRDDRDTDTDTDTDDAMTRSEEELIVGTRSQPTGRARLRKTVVSEDVTVTVTVRREEVYLDRLPLTGDEDVAEQVDLDSDQDVVVSEITLFEEIPVVGTRVVPRERVRLTKQVATEDRQISEPVRRERIDVEDDRQTTSDRS